jgi:hypothetical protein
MLRLIERVKGTFGEAEQAAVGDAGAARGEVYRGDQEAPAGIEEHFFKLLGVSSSQRFVEPELLDGCVIFVCSQELAGLGTEFLEVRSNAQTGQFYRRLIPEGVFEVGIYGDSLAFFN